MENNITKVDSIKKAKFLSAYKQPEVSGNITLACSVAKMSRQTYYTWLEEDEVFRALVYEAKMQMCDEAEATLYSRGMEKDTTALIYWLKNRHPDFKQNEKDFNSSKIQVNNFIPILGKDENVH